VFHKGGGGLSSLECVSFSGITLLHAVSLPLMALYYVLLNTTVLQEMLLNVLTDTIRVMLMLMHVKEDMTAA
jgi:hypothetical protein